MVSHQQKDHIEGIKRENFDNKQSQQLYNAVYDMLAKGKDASKLVVFTQEDKLNSLIKLDETLAKQYIKDYTPDFVENSPGQSLAYHTVPTSDWRRINTLVSDKRFVNRTGDSDWSQGW